MTERCNAVALPGKCGNCDRDVVAWMEVINGEEIISWPRCECENNVS